MEKKPRQIILPPVHKAQQQILDRPERFIVWCAGRRTGKSTVARLACLDHAVNKNHLVWWVAPTYKQTKTHFRSVVRMVGKLATEINSQDKFIAFPGGGEITFRSGDRPDNLLGEGLDFVVLDEASHVDERLWYEVLRPSLSDKNGHALIISTPNGIENWFYDVFIKGQDPNEPEWYSQQTPTTANIYIPDVEKEVAQGKRDLPELRFREQYLAEFVSSAGGVFRKVENVCTVDLLDEPNPDYHYCFGIDWGRKEDFTVITIGEIETSRVVQVERFANIGFEVQMTRLETLFLKWKPIKMYVEQNSMGLVLVEQLQAKYGKTVVPVYMNNEIKNSLIESLAVHIEREKIGLPNKDTTIGKIIIGELYGMNITRTSGGLQVRYTAAPHRHDDCVISLSLVNKGLVSILQPTFQAFKNPFYN